MSRALAFVRPGPRRRAQFAPGSTMPPLIIAVALCLLGIFLLSAMGAIIKFLGDVYPPQQLSALRNLFGLVPAAALLLFSADWHAKGRKLGFAQWRYGLLRGGAVTLAQYSFYVSLLHLEFATASTLVFATPLVMTALSMPVLGERVGPWRWSAVVAGFVGIIMIMQPGSDVFSLYALLPLGAAIGYATSAIVARLIDKSVPTATLNLHSQVSACLGACALTLFTSGFVAIGSAEHWFWIVSMGVLGGGGVMCLTTAYRLSRPANVAPFEYFGIIFAFVLGWIFFAEAPVDRLFPGVLVIVAAGLLIIWREHRSSRGI